MCPHKVMRGPTQTISLILQVTVVSCGIHNFIIPLRLISFLLNGLARGLRNSHLNLRYIFFSREY